MSDQEQIQAIAEGCADLARRIELKRIVETQERVKPITDVRALLGEAQFQARFVDESEQLPVRAIGGCEWL
mgnify:FL=1